MSGTQCPPGIWWAEVVGKKKLGKLGHNLKSCAKGRNGVIHFDSVRSVFVTNTERSNGQNPPNGENLNISSVPSKPT